MSPPVGRGTREPVGPFETHRRYIDFQYTSIHATPSDPEAAERLIAQGYKFVAYSLNITMVATARQQGLSRLRAMVIGAGFLQRTAG